MNKTTITIITVIAVVVALYLVYKNKSKSTPVSGVPIRFKPLADKSTSVGSETGKTVLNKTEIATPDASYTFIDAIASGNVVEGYGAGSSGDTTPVSTATDSYAGDDDDDDDDDDIVDYEGDVLEPKDDDEDWHKPIVKPQAFYYE